jgi:hypothetical protein
MSIEKKFNGLETPDFRLATDEQRVFEKMGGQNKYQMMKLWFQELVRTSDPSAKFDANVGLTATKFKMGLYQQENKAELVDLILEGEYPSNFLTQVRNLIEDHPEISREAAYLNSLKVFYLTHERWPYIAELNRQVIEDHPEAFPKIEIQNNGSLSDDERKMFRRIRKKLNIDWLPEGRIGLKN